jgi:CheY-like chemotaxis protein
MRGAALASQGEDMSTILAFLIVLMTAGSSRESVEHTLERARKTRADFVLQKPFTEAHIRGIFAQSFLEPETVARRKTLLVIDDSKTLRTFIRGVLEFAGYRVQDAESMECAFRDVNIAHVDAVLCDVFMPGMGGVKGMRLIKKTWPSVPVIAMSAGLGDKVSETDVSKVSSKLGADKTLPKPFAAEDLLHAVDATLKHPVFLDD